MCAIGTFTLDKSPAHLAPVTFTGTDGYECGHLRVGLDGGVLLSQTNAFSVLTGVKSGQFGFLSKPVASMWDVTKEGESSRITLAGGGNKGLLDMRGTPATGVFEAVPMGHVTVQNVSTNRLIQLSVRMAVQAGAQTLSEVVAGMVAAGYRLLCWRNSLMVEPDI